MSTGVRTSVTLANFVVVNIAHLVIERVIIKYFEFVQQNSINIYMFQRAYSQEKTKQDHFKISFCEIYLYSCSDQKKYISIYKYYIITFYCNQINKRYGNLSVVIVIFILSHSTNNKGIIQVNLLCSELTINYI